MGLSRVITQHDPIESRIIAFGAMDEELGVMLAFRNAFSPPCGNPLFLPHNVGRRRALLETKQVERKQERDLLMPGFFYPSLLIKHFLSLEFCSFIRREMEEK